MVRPKSFEVVLNSLKERKKFEKEIAKKASEEKCGVCGHNILAIGKSNIPNVCSICVCLAISPIPE